MALESFTPEQIALLPNTSLLALQNTARVTASELTKKIAPLTRRVTRLTGKGRVDKGAAGVNTSIGSASTTRATGSSKSFGLPLKSVAEAYGKQLQNGNDPISNQPGSIGNPDISALVGNLNSLTVNVDTDAAVSSRDKKAKEVAVLRDRIAGYALDKSVAENLIQIIDDEFVVRAEDPSLEPLINFDGLDTYDTTKAEEFITKNAIAPYLESISKYQKLLYGVGELDATTSSMFDLVYGPPISVKGQFVLSQDGLYYDSRVGGMDPSAVLPIPSGDIDSNSSWLFNFPANLGGKGRIYSHSDLSGLINTVFDPHWFPDDQINSDYNIQEYYDTDDVLEVFDSNKALQVHVVSGHITDLIASGYSLNSAMVHNYYSQINAVSNTYDEKIKKRKKQLELVAIFASDLYSFTTDILDDPKNLGIGEGHLIKSEAVGRTTPDDPSDDYWAPIDRIPVNDFSFMRGKGVYVDLQKQQELVIFSEDLDDTILPLLPKFLVTPIQPLSVLDKFAIAPPAPSEWVTSNENSHVSGTGSTVHNLVDRITTSGLILGYNFLKPSAVHASSSDFNLDNFSPDSAFALDAQLVASSVNYLFPSGVAIPYFEGAFYNYDYGLGKPEATSPGGSYVRLPSTHRPHGDRWIQGMDLENLTYLASKDPDPQSLTFNLGGGFSFDCWVHVPKVATLTDGHRYRLILANENTGRGHEFNQQNGFVDNARLQEASVKGTYETWADPEKVHGMIFGFRDAGGSTNSSGLELILAPTVSQNHADGAFHSACIASTFSALEDVTFNGNSLEVPSASSLTDLGLYVSSTDTTASGFTIGDVSSAFMHFAVTFNYELDEVAVFLDSEQIVVSSFSKAFCGSSLPGDVSGLRLPNDVMHPDLNNPQNAYNKSWEGINGQGPLCGATLTQDIGFTPWILGGGYTDSSPSGFMGHNTNDVFMHTKHAASTPIRGGQHIGDWAPGVRARSGLGGHIGSFKMYARPLTTDEVKQNFDAQKGFFKNILT